MDPYTDIAVIKVASSEDFFPAQRATGMQPRIGDRVFAFGSPFGFKFSMSEGIVSGLGRDAASAAEVGGYTNYIQTDAAVNPGNSGGPLADIKGRILGMNVAIATARSSDGTRADDGQSSGISFAIPLGTIESVVDQLITSGAVRRGFMGIGPARADLAVLNVPGFRGTGVRVGQVTPEGPADRAGVRTGDVVVELDGQAVPGWETLRSLVSSVQPGKTIRMKVVRDEAVREVNVVLGEREPEMLAEVDAEASARAMIRYGLVLSRREAVIAEVVPESSAARAGFESGQAIVSVGGIAVRSPREVYEAAAESGILLGKRIPVVVSQTTGESSIEPQTIDTIVVR
jgi:serine protease Do